MAWGRVFTRRRRRGIGVGGALAGLAAGAGLAYFLDPVRGGHRRRSAVERTRRAAHGAADRLPELAGGGALEGVGPWPRGVEAVAVAVGSAAAARALLGRRLLGIPAVLAGAAIARGAVRGSLSRRAHAGRGGHGGHPSTAERRAQRAENRAREQGRDPAAHTGAWHPEPDPVVVVEVKSPAELEPGVAHATPEPTFPDRVSRRGGARAKGGAKRGTRSRPAGATGERTREAGADPSLAEPLPRSGFVSPPAGAGVHAGDLGAFPGPDEADEGEGEPGSDER